MPSLEFYRRLLRDTDGLFRCGEWLSIAPIHKEAIRLMAREEKVHSMKPNCVPLVTRPSSRSAFLSFHGLMQGLERTPNLSLYLPSCWTALFPRFPFALLSPYGLRPRVDGRKENRPFRALVSPSTSEISVDVPYEIPVYGRDSEGFLVGHVRSSPIPSRGKSSPLLGDPTRKGVRFPSSFAPAPVARGGSRGSFFLCSSRPKWTFEWKGIERWNLHGRTRF